MGSNSRKRKKTTDVNVVITEIKQDADQDATKLAIQPTFEGTGFIPSIRSSIDFVNVTDTIDPSQTPA